MEGFLITLLILLLIFLLISVSSTKSILLAEVRTLSKKIDSLKAELTELKKIKQPEAGSAEAVIKPEPAEQAKASPPPVPPKPQILQEEKKPTAVYNVPGPPAIQEGREQRGPIAPERKAPVKKINYEKFIGENLINKIGIGILVLGIGIFVKYAIDHDWIGPIGRIMIGVLCGGILLGLAHYLRKSYKAFSSVLLGGGIATLYFTIYIAYDVYEKLGQTPAFLLMALITGFTVLFSIGYNRIEIAILGILGGFTSPFLVSEGDGNHIILFSYLIILNLGMLVLSYYKKWPAINILCYIFTALIYGGWLLTRGLDIENPAYTSGFIFASIFFLIFFLMNLINNLKEQKKFSSLDFSLILSDAALYFGAGFLIIEQATQGKFTGLFTASLAVFFFIFSWFLLRSGRAEKNLLFLMIGLVMTFISLTAPVQLKGNHITLFWAAEAVLLLWLFQKSGFKIIRTGSLLVLSLMLISLSMDWVQIYFDSGGRMFAPVFNEAFITSLFSFASLFTYHYLIKREEKRGGKNFFDNFNLSPFLKAGLFPISYLPIFLELYYQLHTRGYNDDIINVCLHAYTGLYLLCTYFIQSWQKSRIIPEFFSPASLAYMAWYLGVHFSVISIRNGYLFESTGSGFFLLHYLNAIILVWLLFINYRLLREPLENIKTQAGYYLVPSLAFILFILSAELDHLVVLGLYSPTGGLSSVLDNSHKVGYPILWGIFSFGVMYSGMKRKKKVLRITALVLIFITLLKLAVYDIRDVSEAGKIAAFICLGILLLIVSFLYQKLKILFLEDGSGKSEAE